MTPPKMTPERLAEIGVLCPIAAAIFHENNEPMFDLYQGDGKLINLRNNVMRIEYEYRMRELKIDGGHMTGEQYMEWMDDMIYSYAPPELQALLLVGHRIRTGVWPS